MLKRFRGIIVGLVLGAILSGTIVVAAGNTTTLYNVLNSGIRIVVDGQELHPTDVNGNRVEPMIYNGTTYLPVRAVASALGKAVYWDGPNCTVYLGDMDGKLEYPTVMLTDMTSISESPTKTERLKDNYGNRYDSAIYNDWYNHCHLEYLIAMKYSRFKGILYIPEGESWDDSVVLTIKADGHVIYTSPEMKKTSAPVNIDVSVAGYTDFSIEWSDDNDSRWKDDKYGKGLVCCLANAGFYQ